MIDLVEAEPLRNAIAFALVAAGIALPVWLICRAIASSAISSKMGALAERHRILMRLNYGFEQRLRKRLAEAERIEADRTRHVQALARVRDRIADLQREKDSLTRSYGEEEARNERNPAQLYIARVVNEVMNKMEPGQREHLMLADDWARPQMVEVWASDVAMAKHMLERAFPVSLGYVIHGIGKAKPKQTAAAVAEAEAAAG